MPAIRVRDTFIHYVGPNWLVALVFVIVGVVMMTAAYRTYGTISSVLAAVGVLAIVAALGFSPVVALLVGAVGGGVAVILDRRRRLQGKGP